MDDLAVPDDNADLNASLTAHGLLLKLGGGTTNFLRAGGTWAAPLGGGSQTPWTSDIYPDGFNLDAGTAGGMVWKFTELIEVIIWFLAVPSKRR